MHHNPAPLPRWFERKLAPPAMAGIALLAGLLWCLAAFGPGFLAGTADFWHDPHGIVAGGWYDMATALSGYLFFVRDGWHLPLFQVAALAAPAGTNVIFTDSIPVLAVLGRLIRQATGAEVNLFGAWAVLCFAANAAGMAWLVGLLGGRTPAALVMAAVTGLAMPELLARWGHHALFGQFEILLALILYVRLARGLKPGRAIAASAALAALALWTAVYLLAMVLPIIAAGLLQAVRARQMRASQAAAAAGGTVALLLLLVLVSGYLAGHGALGLAGFGHYSLDALSLVAPALRALTGNPASLVPTEASGQYEGFAYLGLGVIVLLIVAARHGAVAQWQAALRRHLVLAALLAGFLLFALSTHLRIGGLEIFRWSLPNMQPHLASMFRASGRFVWPWTYLLTALAIAGAARRGGRWATPLLLACAVMQWLDVGELRAAVVASTAAAPEPAELRALEAAVARHDFLRLVPTLHCLPSPAEASDHFNMALAVRLELMAAQLGVPVNSAYSARPHTDCPAETAALRPARPGEMQVYFRTATDTDPVAGVLALAPWCSRNAQVALCSQVLSAPERDRLLRPPG